MSPYRPLHVETALPPKRREDMPGHCPWCRAVVSLPSSETAVCPSCGARYATSSALTTGAAAPRRPRAYQAAAPPPPLELERQFPRLSLKRRDNTSRETRSEWAIALAVGGIFAAVGGVPLITVYLAGVLFSVTRKKRG
jgi:hypothetical protein